MANSSQNRTSTNIDLSFWMAGGSVLIATTAAAAAARVLFLYYHHREISKFQERKEKEVTELERRRQEERRGRIRAEVKLRAFMKEHQHKQVGTNNISSSRNKNDNSDTTTNNNNNNSNSDASSSLSLLTMEPIGTVVSPYTKRMGTPRQGALVPSSRGYIDFSSSSLSSSSSLLQMEALDGIEEYSHLWILFGFHANTNPFDSKKVKVRPPRYAGSKNKVGMLSTRSPHRPNPIGLSLVEFEKLDKRSRRLHIKAFDLVNGTPVYDIKPYIPWDIPGYYHYYNANNIGTSNGNSTINKITASATTVLDYLRVPDWVATNDDVIQNVHFTDQALLELEQMLEQNRLAPLYTAKNNGLTAAKDTLQQILAQDPRSSHKGLIKNQRGSTSTKKNKLQETSNHNNHKKNEEKQFHNSDIYKLVFCQTEVQFVVLLIEEENLTLTATSSSMNHSSASRVAVHVVGIKPMDFDPNSFAEGIPLLFSQVDKEIAFDDVENHDNNKNSSSSNNKNKNDGVDGKTIYLPSYNKDGKEQEKEKEEQVEEPEDLLVPISTGDIVGNGATEHIYAFIDVFLPMAERTSEARQLRNETWPKVDLNQMNRLSLGVIERWVRKTLESKMGILKGKKIFRNYFPACIHAFRDAKAVRDEHCLNNAKSDNDDENNGSEDNNYNDNINNDNDNDNNNDNEDNDYITRLEFRLLIANMCAYALMFDAYSQIDNGIGKPGISLKDFLKDYKLVSNHGLVAFQYIQDELTGDNHDGNNEYNSNNNNISGVRKLTAKDIFKQIDTSCGGTISFGEWFEYLKNAELKAKTRIGKLIQTRTASGEKFHANKNSIVQPEL